MARPWRRRTFLEASAAGLFSTAAQLGPFALGAEIDPQTFTYKTVGDCAIKADVYNASPETKRPIAVWIHGGALIMGDRRGIDKTLLAMLIKAGFVVVSIDYRLAPETKLPAILEDVRTAFAWIRQEAPKSFTKSTERIVVLGGSAGGYLTLASGYLIEPRPAALVSLWGYGDIAGTWYNHPDPFYCRQPLVPEAEARASVGTTVIAEPPPKDRRFRFYLYCRQNGLWPKEVAGRDPDTDPHAFDPLCPIRNVSAKYPPAMLIHGTSDTDVPHEQSVLMDRELTRQKVEHELILVRGGGHGLRNISGDEVARLYERVVAFLKYHSV
jgi:acetyl esterase/lipase